MPPDIYIAKSGAKHAPTLPADAVTRTFGIFGVKDSGKTTTGRVIAEGICKLGGHVAIIDPVGVWWGITRDGEGRGVPGIVIGGEHADVPLEETGGHLVAEVVLARQYPAVVVDMKLLRKGAAQRFMADFLEEVYFRNRRPLHLIFEEADRALPQNPRGMDPTLGRVLGAAEDIVKLGRSRGLGSSFLSQRMATVTKNVTEQVEALILHAQVGPRDRKAVKEWVEANGDPARTQVVMDSMASLDVGEAWLYSPKWLKLLERIRVRMPKTLDSSSTPKNDEREVEESAPRAPVDLDALREQMAESVERAKANDPTALRARVAELQRQLAEERVVEPVVERVEVPVLPRERFDQLEALADDVRRRGEALLVALRGEVERFEAVQAEMVVDIEKLRADLAPVLEKNAHPLLTRGPAAAVSRPRITQRTGEFVSVPSSNGGEPRGDGSVSGPEQRVLDSLAWLATAGIAPAQRVQVAMVAGYHERTKGFLNALGALRSAGRIDYPQSGVVVLTPEGVGLARAPGAPPTRGELHEMVFRQVGPAKSRLLEQVIRVWPDAIARPDLAAALDYHERTKGFLNALGSLRTLGLIDYPMSGHVAATDVLFPRQLDGLSVR